MALLAKPIDYTDKDFDSLEARLNNLIDSVFPNWTDRNKANFGNILVDLYSFVGDVLTKYQDGQARETRWTQATARKSLLSLVKLIGYVPSGITAAQVQETFTLAAVAANDVDLPAGSIVSTLDQSNPITYQLLAPLTIPAGTLSATATCENSTNAEDVFASTSQPNQSFQLTQSPYVDASLQVTATDGAYTQVANFLDSGPTDKHFTVTVDSNSVATVTFGNGINGAIPQGTITCDYKTGGGVAGRVDANQLQSLQGSFTDTHGNPVQISVNNVAPSSGGYDAQTNGQIQTLAPLSIRTLTRTIATDDFENVALLVPGVSRVLMTTSNEDPGVLENRGILYVVPPGAGVPSATLIAAVVAAYASLPYPTCFRLAVQSPNYVPVNLSAKVYRSPNTTPAQAKASVLASLASLFADTVSAAGVFLANGERWFPSQAQPQNPDQGKPNALIDFGYKLGGSWAFSGVYSAIATSPGIAKVGAGAADVTLNGLRADVALAPNQWPTLGTVTLIDGLTGQVM